ncbi:FAD-dependent monooxygenase [Actinoallomurus sp. CA-150999]|uniref:FAD-dependent monooxygenase n=1 Tax=Actinoallomurus sp. CA-150999 TaxID=3239887 RepID=UPI003D908D0A
MNSDSRVLVVGAGPVGLTLAHELTRHGVGVRVVDAAAGPSATSRAVATHARSLEIYDQMGVVDELLERGRRMRAFSMHRRGHRLVRMGADYGALPTRYPMTLLVEQATTEEVLRGALARLGVRVEWGVRLTGFEQDADGVTAALEDSGGRAERVRVPWLVGCDGGHSLVRKRLGLRLLGDSSETWLIADAMVDMDVPQDSIHWVQVERGTVMAVPLPATGKWRLLDTVDVGYSGDAREVAARFSRKLAKGFGVPVRVHEPLWVSVFTIQQRMIERMGVGRCFVAGDAAHVHSPASGQGMNTGVQDAFNLAWKLAMVERGQAGRELLESYSAERVPVGATLLRSTRTATALVALKSVLSAAVLPAVFAVVRNAPPLRRRIERKIMAAMSGLSLAYEDGPLTLPGPGGAVGPEPRPGQRVARVTGEEVARSPGWEALVTELRDPRWTLLVFGDGPVARPAESEWLSVRVVDEDLPDPEGRLRRGLGVSGEGWLLIRPDGHVAARGEGLGALDRTPAFGWWRSRDESEEPAAGAPRTQEEEAWQR